MKIDAFYQRQMKILREVPKELNTRTGEKVRAMPGVTFRTKILHDGFPLLSLRKLPMSFIPEQMWFLSGSNKVEWLNRHTKIWDSFAESDGTVTSAYGHRWRHYESDSRSYGVSQIDQLETVLDKLRNDPSSRHGVVLMWQPAEDLTIKQKNVPCPYTFTLMIIKNRLHLHLVVRSNDMVLGFPTDVAGFALLQCILAQELGIEPGVYTHSISNAHIYSMHDSVVNEMLSREPATGKVSIELPIGSYARACALDDSLITDIKCGITGYEPKEPITGIKIAL